MQLTFQLTKSPQEVFPFLADMHRFAQIHPVITRIEDRGDNNYLVYEKMNLGPIPYTTKYPIKVQSDEEKLWVHYHAVISGIAHIYIDITLTGDANHCEVKETIHTRSLVPVSFIVNPIFKKQHAILFQNIDNAS